jgi:hypothetical protein
VREVAQRGGNERLIFWTSVVSLGFIGVMAATMTAQLVLDMVRRGGRVRDDGRGGKKIAGGFER